MSRHYQAIRSSHPSGGSPEVAAQKCCARCRRGTPATGLGECGYGSAGCPNEKCGCHKTREVQLLEAIFTGGTNEQ